MLNKVTDVLPSTSRNLGVAAIWRMNRSMEIEERENMDISRMEKCVVFLGPVSLGHVKHRMCGSFTHQVGGIA